MCANPFVRLLLYCLSSSPDNRASNASAMLQMLIGGINDRVGTLGGDIALCDLNCLAGRQDAFGENVFHANILPRKFQERPTGRSCICYFACATTAAKAFGSRTAMSASILRLRAMFAFLSAATSRL